MEQESQQDEDHVDGVEVQTVEDAAGPGAEVVDQVGQANEQDQDRDNRAALQDVTPPGLQFATGCHGSLRCGIPHVKGPRDPERNSRNHQHHIEMRFGKSWRREMRNTAVCEKKTEATQRARRKEKREGTEIFAGIQAHTMLRSAPGTRNQDRDVQDEQDEAIRGQPGFT
ncbi:MAG: hypothetical protein H6Q00_636 [Holophagaceae bacterium]|nr:hypothetical protein [Holophagaceae bacterium]